MPSNETRHLARAVREHSRGAVSKLGQKIVKGAVVQESPLAVELFANDVIIHADFLILGAWPRYFDRIFGIKLNDTLLLTRLDDGDWYVIDVLSQSDLDGGFDTAGKVNVSFTSRNGHIGALVPFHDAQGNLIGWTDLRSSTTSDGTPV